jgi:hypothetical protein
MKNISLRFILAACGMVLVHGAVVGWRTPMLAVLLLLPVAVITILVSFNLNRVIAHVLNILPVALMLTAVLVGGQDIGYLVLVLGIVLSISPFLLMGFISLWCLARCLRGPTEMELVDAHFPGRRAPLVLPQPSAEGMRKPSNPPKP